MQTQNQSVPKTPYDTEISLLEGYAGSYLWSELKRTELMRLYEKRCQWLQEYHEAKQRQVEAEAACAALLVGISLVASLVTAGLEAAFGEPKDPVEVG